MAPPKRTQGGRGVALGVLGIMLLVFFTFVFLLGKHHHVHHADIHSSTASHPYEDHPLLTRRGSSSKAGTDASKTDQQVQEQIQAAPASPVAAVPENSPPPPPPATAPATTTTTTAAVKTATPAVKQAGHAEQQKAKAEEHLTQLDKDYKPTKEMVQRIAQEGYLVVTWANWHYQDFVRTWIHHVEKSGITGYIVGAMDEHLLQVLVDQKRNVFSMRSGLTLGDFGWGSKTFAKMGREKIKLIRVFLQLGVSVIISDVDVLWLRNPIPFMQQYPEADILTSTDHLAHTVEGYQLEKLHQAGSAANIGIMLFRDKSMPLVNEWIDIIEKDQDVWDQNAFNDLYRLGVQEIPNNPKHLFKAYHGQLTMGILPVAAFCSGHVFFTQQLWKRLNLQPYAVHATFQFSGTPGKRNRMREFMLFDDPPEYYDHKVGFISFKMDGIQELLPGSGPNDSPTGPSKISNAQGHFKLVNHQILRIRNALAMATTLGRAVVMPQMWCGQDRWWAPHAGIIPGSELQLPYQCPLDHVFNLESGLTQSLPADTYGPDLQIREWSFLNNSNLPDSVRNSKVVVEMCGAGEADCSDGTSPAPVKAGKVRVRTGLLSEQLRVALRDVASYKVLEFSTMKDAFKNFTSTDDWNKFFNRVKGIGSIWCCVNAHPGHVHYDPWLDIPHVDKFNRQWDKWVPTTGP